MKQGARVLAIGAVSGVVATLALIYVGYRLSSAAPDDTGLTPVVPVEESVRQAVANDPTIKDMGDKVAAHSRQIDELGNKLDGVTTEADKYKGRLVVLESEVVSQGQQLTGVQQKLEAAPCHTVCALPMPKVAEVPTPRPRPVYVAEPAPPVVVEPPKVRVIKPPRPVYEEPVYERPPPAPLEVGYNTPDAYCSACKMFHDLNDGGGYQAPYVKKWSRPAPSPAAAPSGGLVCVYVLQREPSALVLRNGPNNHGGALFGWKPETINWRPTQGGYLGRVCFSDRFLAGRSAVTLCGAENHSTWYQKDIRELIARRNIPASDPACLRSPGWCRARGISD
jgi:hypothetical protein